VAVAAGWEHSLALKADGTVVAWGRNNFGQTDVPAGLTGVVAISGGSQHSVALMSDGTVVVWGANGQGQTAVPPGLGGVVAIAAGGCHTLAAKGDGTVVSWGCGWGQSTVPGGLSNVVAVAAGAEQSVALKADGTVVAWGSNAFGQGAVPSGLSGVTSIAAGHFHNVARKSDGTVVVWGRNDFGQATAPSGMNSANAVAAGAYHSLAVTLAAPVAISPATATLYPSVQTTFSASGGVGAYSWSVSTNNSGGSITPTGLYTAGPTGGVTDTVTVSDAGGGSATAAVTVTVPVTILPASASVVQGMQRSFTASGGTPPYDWSVGPNLSGGSITQAGVYTAGIWRDIGKGCPLMDAVVVGGTSAPVAVYPPLQVSPPAATVDPGFQTGFMAAYGGTCPSPSATWSLSANNSGGSITASGLYTAGPTGNTTDTVIVVDAATGATATATITVPQTLSVTPGGGTTTVSAGGQLTLTASGGSGPYTWTMTTNGTGGSVTSGGIYTAGPNGGTDTITVTDANGGTSTVTITVTVTPPAGGEAHGAPALGMGHVGLAGAMLLGLGLLATGRRRRDGRG
jgi:hypothetical protein